MKIPSSGLVQTPLEGLIDNQKRYKVAGLRKRKVRELFEKQGPEAAWTLGLKLRLKQGTLRAWFGQWKRNTDQTRTR
jgi:hypothetical protein